MNPVVSRSPLVSLAALTVIAAGLKAAAGLIAPLLVAVFLALISAPALVWLHRHRVPYAAGMILILAAMSLALWQLFLLLESTARAIVARAPDYQARWGGFLALALDWLKAHAHLLSLEWLEQARQNLSEWLLAFFTQGARTLAASMGQLTANFTLVLLAYGFLLLEVPALPQRIAAAFPRNRRLHVRLRRFVRLVNHYLVIKTSVSALTGLAVWALLAWRGVDFAAFFAVLAGLLNFIPTIGSILAAVPAVLLALLQLGPGEALIVTAGYLAINVVLGNVVEPRWMGNAFGLSPFVVLLSLLVWGWVLGAVGAFLSVPLTMVAKLALESQKSTRPWAVLMGDR